MVSGVSGNRQTRISCGRKEAHESVSPEKRSTPAIRLRRAAPALHRKAERRQLFRRILPEYAEPHDPDLRHRGSGRVELRPSLRRLVAAGNACRAAGGRSPARST